MSTGHGTAVTSLEGCANAQTNRSGPQTRSHTRTNANTHTHTITGTDDRLSESMTRPTKDGGEAAKPTSEADAALSAGASSTPCLGAMDGAEGAPFGWELNVPPAHAADSRRGISHLFFDAGAGGLRSLSKALL